MFSKCVLHTNCGMSEMVCFEMKTHSQEARKHCNSYFILQHLHLYLSPLFGTESYVAWDGLKTWYSVWRVSFVLLNLPPKRWDCRAPPHQIYGFHYFLSAHSDPDPCTKDILYGIHCVKGSCGRCWGNLRKHIQRLNRMPGVQHHSHT